MSPELSQWNEVKGSVKSRRVPMLVAPVTDGVQQGAATRERTRT